MGDAELSSKCDKACCVLLDSTRVLEDEKGLTVSEAPERGRDQPPTDSSEVLQEYQQATSPETHGSP